MKYVSPSGVLAVSQPGGRGTELNVPSEEYCFMCGASKVAGMEIERECTDCGPCGGLRLMEGPSRCLGFSSPVPPGRPNLSDEDPEAELASKKDGGRGLSRHTLGPPGLGAVAPPLPVALGLLCMTLKSASKCVLALGSSMTDVFLSSPVRAVPSPPASLMAAT